MPKYTNGFGANTPTRLTANQKAISVNNLVAQSLTGKGKNGNRPWVNRITAIQAGCTAQEQYLTVDSRGNVISVIYVLNSIRSKSVTHVVSTSPTGVVNWTLPLVSASGNFVARSVTTDMSDNIIVAGQVSASITTTVVKISPDGSIVWQKALGSWTSTLNYHRVCTDSAGSIYMSGYISSNNIIIVIKFDVNGSVVWQKYSSKNTSITGTGDMTIDPSGNSIFTFGSFQDSGCCGQFSYTWIMRLSTADGTTIAPTIRYAADSRQPTALAKVPMAINPTTGKYYFTSYQGTAYPDISILNSDWSSDSSFRNTGLNTNEIRSIGFTSRGQMLMVVCNRNNPASYSLWLFDTADSNALTSAPTLVKTISFGGGVVNAYDMKIYNDAVYIASISSNTAYVEKIVLDRSSYADNRINYTNTQRRETNLFASNGYGPNSDSATNLNGAYPEIAADISLDSSVSTIRVENIVVGS